MDGDTAEGGLEVVFDPALDGGGWPGPLAGRRAAAGRAWLGPRGLLARLELELGLGGRPPSRLERACRLARALEGETGFWSESFKADRLATCERLIRDRDLLSLWGWRGEPASERLSALWRVTGAAGAGVPDRLRAVLGALDRRRPDVARVELGSPEADLPPLWRRVLAALRGAGVAVRERAAPNAGARGDLARAREPGFAPQGDGRLVLFRAHGPLAAADEVAGSLAAADDLAGAVIVGADRVLDEALARHGLPRVGAGGGAPASVALVRLCLEAMFDPSDPADVHALLTLDPGPVPGPIARRLVGALRGHPGRGSPRWRDALDRGLERLDEDRRERARARVSALLEPAAARDRPVPAAVIRERLGVLATWARGAEGRHPSLGPAIAAAESCRQLVTLLGADALSRTEVRRLADVACGGAADAGRAEAGLAAVAEPGAVLGPAKTVLWWGFSRDAAPTPPRIRLSRDERAALAASGIASPDFGLVMAGEARRWRRPLAFAQDALVLVCPQTDEVGDRCFPHPLWDELTASLADPRHAPRLEVGRLELPAPARRATARPRPRPAPAPRIRTGVPLAPRDRESPSSLERLLGCSLAWALQYAGRLRAGLSAGPVAPSPLLYGNVAHHVLERVFEGGARTADAAAARADALVDGEIDALCENLRLPRYLGERATLRRAIVESARELGRVMQETGAELVGVEHELERELPQLRLGGVADVVLRDPDLVLDFKWGKATNRKRLARGAALQLAAYAELAASGGERPGVAYLALGSQQLFAEPGTPLAGVEVPGTARAVDTWRGAMAALADRVGELGRGELAAPAAAGEELESQLAGGRLDLAPPCRYCDFGGLCGRGGGL